MFTNPAKKLKTDSVPAVNRIVIQEMVNDIIDKTKDNNTAIVKCSDSSPLRLDDTEAGKRTKLSDKTDDTEVKLESETETEITTVPQTTTNVGKTDVEIKDDCKTRKDSALIDKEKETKSDSKYVNEPLETETDKTEVNTTGHSEKVIESTSDGDDSGNFSLEESFENSVSDVNKSESDDIVSCEKTSGERMVADKNADTNLVDKTCKKTITEENESDIHDDVFTDVKDKQKEQSEEKMDMPGSECETVKSNEIEVDKVTSEGERIHEKYESTKLEERADDLVVSETVESSTSTCDLDTTKESVSSSLKAAPKVYGKDDLVSEPIVSSTQNTQGCQTDESDNEKPKPGELSSKDDDMPSSNFDSHKLTIDVSCETENLEMARQTSKESVSVSTDTEELSREATSKRKSVDSSTITDIPYKSAKKNSTDSGTVTTFQEKVAKPLSPRRLSPNPAVMEAQPLSPTRITLKLASPTSPIKRPSQSPSRADSSTFLSKFESFVNELPDKSQDFEPPYTTVGQSSIQTVSPLKIQEVSKKYEIKPDPSPKASVQIPVKRPRGRPPKNKSADTYLVTKHKSHKSRSNSPKRKRSYEKQKSESYAYSYKSSDSVSLSKSSDSKSLKQDSLKPDTPSTSQPQEKKIPKHFVLFSNGQYTLATENNISKFKQSSPLSPTRTVSDTVLSSYGDKDKYKDKYSKTAKSNSHALTDKHVHKSDCKSSKRTKSLSQELPQPQPTLKPLKITISEPPAPISKNTDRESVKGPKNIKEKNDSKLETNVDVTKSLTTTVPSITVPSVSFSHSKDLSTSCESKTVATPEYRHQSPFFTSLSGAKLTSPHRPSAHLNIPNLNSHFAGTHYLYAQNSYRYTNDRLGSASFRSLPGFGSSETKTMGLSAINSKNPRDIVTSHSAIVPPFLSPLSIPSMMHLPATQTFPMPNINTSASPKGYSPDSTKSPHQLKPDSHNGFSVPMNNTSNIKTMPKPISAVRKTKEKSIDNVISAITEMRAKKEGGTSEQLTGMDLSTKSRNSPLSCDRTVTTNISSEDKIKDKYAFTDDDDDVPSKRPNLHVKPSEHRKSLTNQKESI